MLCCGLLTLRCMPEAQRAPARLTPCPTMGPNFACIEDLSPCNAAITHIHLLASSSNTSVPPAYPPLQNSATLLRCAMQEM